MMYRAAFTLCALVLLNACAGRTPAPVAAVQPTDTLLTCFMIEQEIATNNDKIIELSGEEGKKVAQNVTAGVAGLFIWPLWFAMDFQDAAGKEGEALQTRNNYLANLYTEKDCHAADDNEVIAQTSPKR